ncbi:uncharacterized protein LOC131952123 [Physella acuta]|uniref:uncharacterized protein LOC131952123 n=1 Tax=Physella acuta TaxID=109671 RepID=UPI0027DB1588|nr:uncharacterized protein LOC131952123 [Physella acuta]
MSMRTRIRGFTAWVNLRLTPYNQLMSNVLMDLLSGTSMKHLTESITGRIFKKLDNMDGLSQQQVLTRVQWMVDELKQCGVLPNDVYVDPRMFAMRSADHVFEVLWRLISHDIWFVWERYEFFQLDDPDIITQVPFKWTPDPPPMKKKKKIKKSLLSGFGASAFKEEPNEVDQQDWIKFPNSELMMNFKKKKPVPGKYPAPDSCILEIVNAELKKTNEGRKLHCYGFDDLVDSRILCALVNGFVPSTFPTDLLLNDRWTINLVLRTAEKMFYSETPFDSEDLGEADGMAVSAYFTFFFMVAFKYRQCEHVAAKATALKQKLKKLTESLDRCPTVVSNLEEMQKRKDFRSQIDHLKEEIKKLSLQYDTDYCKQWVEHVLNIKTEVRKYIDDCMKKRFETVVIPRNITINNLCLSCAINLSLSKGSGFYLSSSSEVLTEGRQLILKLKKTGEFIDDFSLKNKGSVKQILGITKSFPVEVNPANYPQYEFYFEALSRNKYLKIGSIFLYQIFPGTTTNWQKALIRAAKDNDADSVNKMVSFFSSNPSFINSKDAKTGQTALHLASRHGYNDMVQTLLENGAAIDAKDNSQNTALFHAIDGLQKEAAHLLIEWGCDVHCRNSKRSSPFEVAKNEEFRLLLVDLYNYYSTIVPKIMKGDKEIMIKSLANHINGEKKFHNLHSRCINGSTLLHTASYYGYTDVIEDLLQLNVDINLKDYKGASPLHRAKNAETIKMLLDNGADIDAEDSEGNTCLHVKCYGQIDQPTEMAAIKTLLDEEAKLLKRNKRNLLPIHCCVMQGRIDATELLLDYDPDNTVKKTLNSEKDFNPPSLLHLAIANNFLSCAEWLSKRGFQFKAKEQDILLQRILTEKVKVSNLPEVVQYLFDHGANPNPIYPDGNTAIHFAAKQSGSPEVLEVMLSNGAQVDSVNDEGYTPLMLACQTCSKVAACILINNGANVRQKNMHGQTALDYIEDYEEWIQSGYFSDEVIIKLKAFDLKNSRELVRAISHRIKSASAVSTTSQSFRSAPHTAVSTRTRSQTATHRSTPHTGLHSLPSAQSRKSTRSYKSLPAIEHRAIYIVH